MLSRLHLWWLELRLRRVLGEIAYMQTSVRLLIPRWRVQAQELQARITRLRAQSAPTGRPDNVLPLKPR